MNVTDSEIRRRLRLGEDSGWEFKRFEFRGDLPTSPRREDLADEMVAFANASGGTLLCGVEDDGRLQDMSPAQMAALDRVLVEVSTDAIEPALRIEVHHRELDGRGFVLVAIPRGEAVHERSGRAFIRVGATKRRLGGDERLRLAQGRAPSRYLRFDRQVVPGTGIETLDERLWGPLLSVAGAADPSRGLANLRLLAEAEGGVERATVAGVLLCARRPQEWLPQATIMATHYRGTDRASGQLDGQEIAGPLTEQIAAAVGFVARNMRVAARKTPARENLPQYSQTAVFEAVVNAVAHRDYSIASQRIRLSMFSDRLEIDSPGRLANGMTIDAMASSQATRNEVVASVFGRFPVGDMPGSGHRRYLMERRGDGGPDHHRGNPPNDGLGTAVRTGRGDRTGPHRPRRRAPAHAGGGHGDRAPCRVAATGSRCRRALPEQDLATGNDRRCRRSGLRPAQHAPPDDRIRRRAGIRREA